MQRQRYALPCCSLGEHIQGWMEAWLFLGLFGLKSEEGKRLRTSATCHLEAKIWKLKTMRNTKVQSGGEITVNLGQHGSFVVKATDSGPDNRVFNNRGGRVLG